ncbi:MAG: 16S rRNA (adenine(1518)-N(6)/adenine(1519)-N(6))-dimethyltransferase RsmA [Porticoccaceae bacterium]|nr:16S rRNA (adenine(1518)-N(6)/adenine(1519)-N(6))-dimethyltransferase RsmA [Porticoccaceae bacterium]
MNNQHKPRKRFGQNFLIDQQVIGQIVAAINPQVEDNLIEIGPGMAAITEHLVKLCPSMTLVELDRDLIEFLKKKLSNYPLISIINSDALKTDFGQFYQGGKLRLVGNLPYNISTPLLFHLLETRENIRDMHFMLQREVVDRLSASPGQKSYGRLSVMIQYHCRVMPLIPVPPMSFNPAPKVQSAVVRLTPYSELPYKADNTQLLSQIVRLCFQQRRKTLKNCLNTFSEYLSPNSIAVDLTKRPEQLSVKEFVTLCNSINKNMALLDE